MTRPTSPSATGSHGAGRRPTRSGRATTSSTPCTISITGPKGFGVKWVDLKVQEGNSVLRWTRPERNGQGLMTRLIDGFLGKGGEIVPATEITAAHGRERPRHRPGGPRCHDRRAGLRAQQGRRRGDRRLQLESRHGDGAQSRAQERQDPGRIGARLDRHRAHFRPPGGRLSHPHGPHLVLRLRHARLSRSGAAARPRVSPGAGLHLGQPAGPPIPQRGAVGRKFGDPGADGAEPAPRLGDHGLHR